MSRPLIDFHKVRSHDGDQRLGFEALCRLLGPAISGVPDAALTHYGRPDAGAEMLARTATGAVWAWQAKWLFSLDDSAVSQMDESFKAAIARHPYTTDYVFCLPCERPEQRHGSARKSAMQRWKDAVDRWTQWAREEHGAKVTLHWIGETVLIGELLAERNSGILRYFFDLTSLGADWFSAQIGDAVRAVARATTRGSICVLAARDCSRPSATCSRGSFA